MSSAKSILFLTMFACLLVLNGCGGSGSSFGDGSVSGGSGNNSSNNGSSGTASGVVAGVVADGPLQGATVSLYVQGTSQVAALCGPSGSAACETKTDSGGNFTFQVRTGGDSDALLVVASGGRDGTTGVDFSGMKLVAPLAMFPGRESSVTVSPLTTLVSGAAAGGTPVLVAEAQVRILLGLDPGTDLGQVPSQDVALLRRSLLLTKIASEIKTGSQFQKADTLGPISAPEPFQAINALVKESQALVDADGNLNTNILADLNLDAQARQRIAETYSTLQGKTDGLAKAFGQQELVEGLSRTLARMHQDDETFDPQNATYQKNISLLAAKIRLALGDKILPLGGIAPQRLARYVLFTYDLTPFDIWLQDSASFEQSLVRQENGSTVALGSDPNIGKLADIKALYSVAVPLLADELPGDDNLKRINYYYNSDASPFYTAEKLIGGVFNDQLNDDVMSDIAHGEAENGLLDQARTFIETQIFQSQDKADAYRTYALDLLRFGKTADAISNLKKAEDLYRKVIDAKGAASLASSDAANLQWLAAAYRQAGDLASAQAVLAYLDSLTPYLTKYSTFARLLTGTEKVADAYLQEGRVDQAAPLIDSMYALAQRTPPNDVIGLEFYSLKVYFLKETAKRYVAIGDTGKVLEIFNLIQSIRADDGLQNLTKGDTWPYMPDMVAALYQVGAKQQAFDLADSIPDTFQNFLGSTRSGTKYQKQAFKLVATYEALTNGLPSALTIINEHFPDDTDKIEALTYFALNKEAPYVALALIGDGQLQTAKQALDLAANLVAGLAETSDADKYRNMVQEGCVKIADLYYEAGDDADAELLLGRAESVVGGLTGAEYVVDGLADIASTYVELGNAGRAGTLLDQAGAAIDAAAGALDPRDAASLYQTVIEADLAMGRREAPAALLADDVAVSRQIFDPTGSYTGSDHDKMAGYEIDELVTAADEYIRSGDSATAIGVLDEAWSVAGQMYTDAKAMQKKVDIVATYCKAGDLERGAALANSLPYATDRYQAIEAMAAYYAQKDDFPGTRVASIDTDKDGMPDFFNPLATPADIAASGLTLDPDSDGDGIPDVSDARPLYPDN